MYTKKIKRKMFLLCLPGFAGFLLFYLLPFCRTLLYSIEDDTYHHEVVGLNNYFAIFRNSYFRLALKNTILFSILGVSLLILIAVTFSFLISSLLAKNELIQNALLFPMFLPTVSVIFVWKLAFESQQFSVLFKEGSEVADVVPILLLFLWKNTGLVVVILLSAIARIPDCIFEAAQVDGAARVRRFCSITLPLISPTLFFSFVISFVNSMKIFRESYLYYGNGYPPDSVYTVQFYMNNHFQKLNYQNLSCASVIVAVFVGILIVLGYQLQNHVFKDVEL